ncbi:MAG: methyltransferase, partial [Bryobacterales bacterium]|nr:methyltransferase [Bryobacterales bacterium]
MKSPRDEVVEMAMAYSRSRIVCAAARLRIADALANGEQTVEALAGISGAHAGSLHRLLRALASIGILSETRPGTFALTDLGQPLRQDAPHSAWPAVIFWADLLADNWTHLTECVRTGEMATKVMERAGLQSRWSTDPDAGAVFRAVMGTADPAQYAAIARSWDFAAHGTVADLGGGGGSLLLAILAEHPALRGLLVDRAASIDAARPRLAAEANCRLVAADLLDTVPDGADVYVLKHVLHGYDDANAARILRHCRAVLPPGGRVLIVEFVLPAVVNQVDAELEKCLMSDLNMLAVTGGRERTAVEWTALIKEAGLRLERVVKVTGAAA